jgi:hypothetical protein
MRRSANLLLVKDEHELRADSDRMFQMLRRLRETEEQKRLVGMGTPEFVELAAEVERLSRLIFRWSGIQMQSAHAMAAAVERGDIAGEPLEAVKPRPLDEVLAAWREAQVRFELARPGSEEARVAADEIERIREEFHAIEANKRELETA